MQLIKGMEKAFLCLLFAADKLDVINQQHSGISVFMVKIFGFPFPDGGYKIIGKLLGADTDYRNIIGCRSVANRV